MAEMTEKQMEMLLKSDADRTKGFTQEEINEIQRALDEQKLSDPRLNRFFKSLPEDEEMMDDPRPNRFFKSLPEDEEMLDDPRPNRFFKSLPEDELKEEFSPGLEEDRTAPLKEEPETRKASADMSVGEFVASMLGDDKNEEVVTAAEGGSIEKEADFVKDDDEEPADPPPGATPEEVADDIPAYLSTGEYVLPANVVRYIGLQQIVAMHKGALSELQQMEDLDIIENVDENGMVEEDDDEMDYLKEPKGVVKTTLVVAKPHPSGMMAMPFAQGGAPGGPDDTGAASDIGDPDAVDEMDPEDTGFSLGLGLEDEDPGGYAGARRSLDPSLMERLEDAARDFTTPKSKTDMPNHVAALLGPIGLAAKGISSILGNLSDKGYDIDPDSAGPDVDDTEVGGGEPDDPITKQAKEDDETEKTKKLIEELERSKGGKRYKVDPVEALRFGQLGEEYTRGSFFQR